MVLHTRRFRETSLLVDLVTPEYGRLRAVARGARRPGNRQRGLLQLFQPILATLRGRGELLTLVDAESAAASLQLQAERMFSGLYLNELMIRLLPMHQPCSVLFSRYHETLRALAGSGPVEPVLRYFEMDLLEECGYGLDLWPDAAGGSGIEVSAYYLFHPEQGFEAVPGDHSAGHLYSGELLDVLRRRRLEECRRQLPAAKRLLRQALAPHLGSRPLQSRDCFSRLSPHRSGR